MNYGLFFILVFHMLMLTACVRILSGIGHSGVGTCLVTGGLGLDPHPFLELSPHNFLASKYDKEENSAEEVVGTSNPEK